MKSLVGAASFAVLTMGVACSNADITTQPTGPTIPMVRLRAEPYSFASVSGFDKPARIVVRDAAAWRALWSQIYVGRAPVPAPPAIDFSREMVVVVALGSRSTGGYGILLVDASEEAAGGAAITVRSSSPGSSCGVTLAFTQPVDVARLPLRQGSVRFVERSEVFDCK
ncbi:MAG TPA: protease complex subunit PrcB family protein [Gemmatimonadaceae bacterium]|nr:protease complex subunit PrcB family protein [Gemmatimonadaceae bacterium]